MAGIHGAARFSHLVAAFSLFSPLIDFLFEFPSVTYLFMEVGRSGSFPGAYLKERERSESKYTERVGVFGR